VLRAIIPAVAVPTEPVIIAPHAGEHCRLMADSRVKRSRTVRSGTSWVTHSALNLCAI